MLNLPTRNLMGTMSNTGGYGFRRGGCRACDVLVLLLPRWVTHCSLTSTS